MTFPKTTCRGGRPRRPGRLENVHGNDIDGAMWASPPTFFCSWWPGGHMVRPYVWVFVAARADTWVRPYVWVFVAAGRTLGSAPTFFVLGGRADNIRPYVSFHKTEKGRSSRNGLFLFTYFGVLGQLSLQGFGMSHTYSP